MSDIVIPRLPALYHPKTCHLAILFWAVGTWKQQNQERLSMNNLNLPKHKSSSCHKGFTSQEGLTQHRSGDQKSTPCPDKLCHKLSYFPSMLPRVHSSSLNYSPLRSLHPSPFSLLRRYLILNSEDTSSSYSIFLSVCQVYRNRHVNKLMFVFLLLILSFCWRVPAENLRRVEVVLPPVQVQVIEDIGVVSIWAHSKLSFEWFTFIK